MEKAKSKIYVFSNVVGGGEGMCCAIADSGKILATAFCANEHIAKSELGVNEGTAGDCHEVYKKYYPDGYELEFIPASELEQHEDLRKALESNKNRFKGGA